MILSRTGCFDIFSLFPTISLYIPPSCVSSKLTHRKPTAPYGNLDATCHAVTGPSARPGKENFGPCFWKGYTTRSCLLVSPRDLLEWTHRLQICQRTSNQGLMAWLFPTTRPAAKRYPRYLIFEDYSQLTFRHRAIIVIRWVSNRAVQTVQQQASMW